ncbi:hypothetical protein AA0112_g1960 [Alternaria arborescens]|nr:hypothetical protein AA0112_g1960 [Alternaria arborescens]
MESPPTSLASEKERQVNVVDWHGNDDAANPAMFMPLRMLFLSRPIFFTSLLTAIGYGYIYVLYTTLPTTFVETYK